MTKISPEVEVKMPMEAVLPVSADVSFASNSFPKYKLGADSQILEEPMEDNQGPLLKEVIEQEASHLSQQHKRLSVRDLASKFDKNLAAAAKLSNEAKLREVASLEGHVLLKKLRDALESLRGRLAGRNKEDVEKAISMVEALAVKLTQKEGELIQEKFEVKKLANFLKQASEDAKKLVNQEKSFACAEIESARAVVLRIGEALEEQEKASQASKRQDVGELVEEVQEARRIKLLHQPSKVMAMEHELRALRDQIREKSIFSIKLQKELTMSKRDADNKSCPYKLDGSETLGSYLRVQPCSDEVPPISKCSFQWYRLSSEGSWREVISGAKRSIYASDPFDVGRILQVDIVSNGKKLTLTTGPIQPEPRFTVDQAERSYGLEEGILLPLESEASPPSASKRKGFHFLVSSYFIRQRPKRVRKGNRRVIKMASRPVVPLQPRGDAVVGGGKQQEKKNAAAEGRNRRVLGDIGNLVTVKGIEVKPNRPITRSFGAQLLANAQAAENAEINKKEACANVVGPPPVLDGVVAAKRGARKPAQKKVTIKPKPEEVIEISSDEEVKKAKKKEGDGNSRKKSHTLTSVLTARSKAACGLAKKPKEKIDDIDAADAGNELAAVEYIEDIYKFYKLVEHESRPHDYMDSQPELNERMRAILVDWLIDVNSKFDLSLETLYLTINIIDRFLAVKAVPRRELQLVGMSAMLLASKYEEIWPPTVNDFVCLSDTAYTEEQILVMEKIILGKLEWTLTVPTTYVFLVRFIKASIPDQEASD
ncbi:stomatal closure-related actin-binding protein 3-like [Senna tora]|uniref:B-like cyclin n=1 Tax=Senna tora TaxID=362788 RepID=A0A834TKE5_9FABA|nr:stomatal closure-related actin-binding protein 3-like [Senna tora]